MRIATLPSFAVADRVTRASEPLALIGAPIVEMPAHVRAAASAALDGPLVREPRGLPRLRAAIAADLAATFGIAADPETELLITHGAMHGLSLTLRALLRPGDEVLVPSPAFFFDFAIEQTGARAVYVPAGERDDWAWDVEALRRAVTPRTTAIVVCNPNNPTGYVPDAGAVAALVEVAAEHELTIVTDDSWQRFVHDDAEYVPIAGHADRWSRIVTVTSLSKAYAFADWRIGYVLAQPATIAAIGDLLGWDAAWVSHVNQAAAGAAVSGPAGWWEQPLRGYQARRDRLLAAIRAAGYAAATPRGGAFALVDCSVQQRTPASRDELLARAGIRAIPGPAFHAPEQYVRLLFGAEAPVLDELARRLRRLTDDPPKEPLT
ncbi:pyridoxal phosphate-dependent aminotransferase [Conexibacter sp. CPCC 206217]|uniref:pyridoxal phosphate-dependent aminotransferase n=1 Tax=Conexibacter sp. CPCC 206217 TaxID=3064574 RepID=UPI0027276DAD|nr:pyridoxal phosphate-dependent aminotransferase [Conexibacter sp. CPCC 206217]MDO8208811.1 pyridoxal phosphate-dependent aminotransferase [Conexibacter sp. CPCC 206217]